MPNSAIPLGEGEASGGLWSNRVRSFHSSAGCRSPSPSGKGARWERSERKTTLPRSSSQRRLGFRDRSGGNSPRSELVAWELGFGDGGFFGAWDLGFGACSRLESNPSPQTRAPP